MGNEELIRWTAAVPGLWLGLSAHEAAHGLMASWRGDNTAKEQGRLTLFPFKHLNLLGSLLVPLAMLHFPGGLLFGWARPAPVDPARLRNPKRDFSLVALAGPMANLVLAALLALVGRLAGGALPWWAGQALAWAILANVTLCLFNLAPLPGLDGIKALFFALPERWCFRLNRMEPWVFLVLLVLLAYQVLNGALVFVQSVAAAICAFAGLALPES